MPKKEGWHLPIIPVLGAANEDVKLPPLQLYSDEQLRALRGQVAARLDRVMGHVIAQTVKNPLPRYLAKSYWWIERRKALEGIMRVIDGNLDEHHLRRRRTARYAAS